MTPAVKYLQARGVPYRLLEYPHEATHGYGMEAALALGLAPVQVFKTLVSTAVPATRNAWAVAVVPVNTQLGMKALASVLGHKRMEMATPENAERATGFLIGGISPFGQRRRLPTVLDESALAHDEIFVSGGRRGLEIGLAPEDFVRCLRAQVANIGIG